MRHIRCSNEWYAANKTHAIECVVFVLDIILGGLRTSKLIPAGYDGLAAPTSNL